MKRWVDYGIVLNIVILGEKNRDDLVPAIGILIILLLFPLVASLFPIVG
jgi:hypothetical protein